MNLKIKYFGVLAEITNCSEETITYTKGSVSDVLMLLFEKYPALKETDFQVAQDLEIVSKDTLLLESEIALLPPFSGG